MNKPIILFADISLRREGSTLVVNVLDNSKETLAAASLERLRQDHISRLAENTSKQAGNECSRDRYDPLEIIGGDPLFLGKGRVEQTGNNIERNLLSHGVRNLNTFRCSMRSRHVKQSVDIHISMVQDKMNVGKNTHPDTKGT